MRQKKRKELILQIIQTWLLCITQRAFQSLSVKNGLYENERRFLFFNLKKKEFLFYFYFFFLYYSIFPTPSWLITVRWSNFCLTASNLKCRPSLLFCPTSHCQPLRWNIENNPKNTLLWIVFSNSLCLLPLVLNDKPMLYQTLSKIF